MKVITLISSGLISILFSIVFLNGIVGAQSIQISLVLDTEILIIGEDGEFDIQAAVDFEKQIHEIFRNIEAVKISGKEILADQGFYGIKIYLSKTPGTDLYRITYIEMISVGLNINNREASEWAFKYETSAFTEVPMTNVEIFARNFEKKD